jgi:hypothetical protein
LAPPNRRPPHWRPLQWHLRAAEGAVHCIIFGSHEPYSITSSARQDRKISPEKSGIAHLNWIPVTTNLCQVLDAANEERLPEHPINAL